jgi:hypothetical protein
MTKIRFPLIQLALCTTLLTPLACETPPEETEIGATVESHEDELRHARPVKDSRIPTMLKPERIGGLDSKCVLRQDKPLAEVRYRATRGQKVDAVVLTFAREAEHLTITHRRNGHDLGTLRVNDATLGVEGRDSFLRPGLEHYSAFLLAEMTSTGVMARLPDAFRCVSNIPAGGMTSDGATYLAYGWCEFGWDSLNIATAVVSTASQVACCATAGTASLGAACVGCVVVGETLKSAASVLASEGRSDCGGQAPDPRDEQIRILQEQMRQNDEWRDAEIKRRLDEEDKKAWEEFEKAQKEEEERIRNEASKS